MGLKKSFTFFGTFVLLLLPVSLIILAPQKVSASAGDIYTLSGTGEFLPASGVPAAASGINNPQGVTADAFGNTYFADVNNNLIRKVDKAGLVTTVAGTGTAGYSGDGGPATAAKLSAPAGVCVDSRGAVYFADRNNNRVRKIGIDGTIKTVAGKGTAGYSGDRGMAVSASLRYPQGVAVDSNGNLYIADTGNNRIRVVNTLGVITTFAGTGRRGYNGDGMLAIKAKLNRPIDISLDSAGDLYIADTGNSRVRKVNAATMRINTVAGNGSLGYSGDGGAAVSASLNMPAGVSIGSRGVLIADTYNNRIRVVDNSGIITTAAGTGTAGFSGDGGMAASAGLNMPAGVSADTGGNVLIADTLNNRVRMVEGPSYALPIAIIGSPMSGSSIGGSVTITGSASGANGVAYVEVSPDRGATWYTATGTSSWSYYWTPPALGNYYILSRATDSLGNKGSIMGCVAVSATAVTTPVVINSLTASPASPVTAGASVVWTASASGGSGSYLYQFMRKGPDTGGTFVVAKAYSTSNTWSWTTTAAMAGSNTIQVYVKNSDGTGEVSSTAPAYTVSYSGPVGYWKLDETSGTTASDTSGLGNNGTLSGAVRVGGVSGSAVSFDGTGTYVAAPGTASLKPASTVSVTAWVKTSTAPALGGEVVSMGDNYVLRVMASGNVLFFLYDGTTWITLQTSGVNVLDGKWHHLAGVKSAGQLQVFVDGALKAAYSTSRSIPYTLGTSLYIGRHGDGSTSYNFNGTIDEVRVYGRDLSAAEVQAIYASITPPAPTISPISVASLTANPATATAGATVTWTASASGGSGSYLYQFMRKGPDTGGTFVVAKAYGTSNTWSWTTTAAMAGSNTIQVYVKNSDGTGEVSSTAPAYTVSYSGPVGYWKLDETSGTTASDTSGLGNNGTLSGAVRVGGVSGSAVSFDGTGTYVAAPGTASLKPASTVSVTAWVKTSTAPALGGEVVSMGDNYVLRVMASGNVLFFLYDGTTWITLQTSGVNVLDGKWHHLAGVKSAGQLQVFVDGALKAAYSTSRSIPYTLGTSLYIGRHGDGSTSYNFNGTIDEVRVYGRDLSAAEVQAIYASITPPAPTISPISVASLTANPATATAGAAVTWTASASGGSGSYLYQFSRMGPDTGGTFVVAKAYSTSNTWSWTTAAAMAGTNTITVSVRNSDGTGTVTRSTTYNVTAPATSPQATLTWIASTSASAVGYRIYIGTASGSYTQSIDAGKVTTYTVSSLSSGKTYYFTVAAYDSYGNKSAYSNEVSKIIP